jgi:hypothetical protein
VFLTSLTGTCSDSLITMQLDPSIGPVRYGICVVQYNQAPGYTIPGCVYPNQYCPMGCCDYTQSSPASCEAEGGSWYLPASSQSECSSNIGCYEADTNAVTEDFFLHRFSTKDKAECGLCSQEYVPWFSWTPATYLTGNYKALTRIETTYAPRFNWTDALDFNQLFNLVLNASNDHILSLGASSALCQ